MFAAQLLVICVASLLHTRASQIHGPPVCAGTLYTALPLRISTLAQQIYGSFPLITVLRRADGVHADGAHR